MLVIDACCPMRCNTLNSWVPRRNQGRKASSALPQAHVAAWSWLSGQAHLTRLHVAPPPGVEVKVSRGEELVFVFRVILEVTECFVIPRLQLSISGRDWATTAMTMASSQWGQHTLSVSCPGAAWSGTGTPGMTMAQVRPAAATCGFLARTGALGPSVAYRQANRKDVKWCGVCYVMHGGVLCE